MIVDKGGEEIGLKLQDLSLKILGVEIKFSSPCVRLLSVFQFLSVRSVRPVLCSSKLQSVIIPFLELGLEKNIVLLNVLCMFRSFCNLCAMSNLCFVIIYSQVL
jgi:hypothetical protein